MAPKIWRIDLREIRTQILFWYAGLMGLFLLIALPLIYGLLFTQVERAEIKAVMAVVAGVLGVDGVLVVLLAWWISGRILQPLGQITDTLRQLSPTTLSQRIPAQGSGELATLAQTCNQMLDRLQATFANQQSFINDASHELRTPIAIIQGHLDLIGELPPEQQEVVDLVLDETERMSRFVRDLLLLSQSEQPDFINPAWVELEGLTEEIYNKARGLVKGELQLDAKARGQVSLDRQRITQAVLNLVENAIQHTPTTGVIGLGSDLSDAHVCFWVRDTGTGIALADQQRIFERFARSSANSRRSDGAGLGLSIVKAIATACQGRVELYSQSGKGATFMLLLPLHPSPHRDPRSRIS